ncbi:alpha/beta hydrolase [Xylanimonas oleitrophica]|uniref:Alpha/beta hydrolase n=1 Tax=Xylanimonas oleitrophica TaxID=2607479 RepID=A0A2W5WRZ8_9MICO|nr:acyl-CoA thioester hydrolase/BAAT C-terminal domain-containing protein [Xylanimonas oleitrophica]PZR53890.1 alpha/beta hydrolase [Xylanimonas oleitrophica]
MRTVGSSAAILVGLAVVGSLAGPSWDPVPVSDHLQPATSSTAVQGVGDSVAAGLVHEPGTFEVRATEVTVALDGAEVGGILREPVGAGDDLPGMVFVHGAGTGRAAEAFLRQADAITSAGIVTLVPDKRLDTYTTWHRDYVAMADDYLRSVELLREVDGVDPGRVGVYAESEGTWIAPVMQVHDPAVAYTVLVSAPVVPPRQQAAFAVDNYLRNTGVPQDVFRAIPRAVGIQLPGGGLDYADFDVTPWLERQTAPVLVVYGTGDPSMPIEQGARKVIADTAVRGDDAPVTVRYYADANHGLRVDGVLVPEFPRDVAAWISALPDSATAPPRVAGAQPDQLFLASPVAQPGWWGDGDFILGAVIAGVALLVVGPVLWLVVALGRRIVAAGRGAPGTGPGAWLDDGVRPLLVGLGVGSVLTTVALVVYLMAVARLALNYQRDDAVVQGGWIGVRLLGLVTVVVAAHLLQRVRDVRAERQAGHEGAVVASGWPAHVTLWTATVGAFSLLLWLTYWGVFQLGI